jgi:hypothetical protein
LISGDIHNPEGYFERADVTALQEQLLIDLERWWPSPRGMQPLPEGWLESSLGQRALADLIALLEPEAALQQGPWAIKDPRSSLLLPLWRAACQQLGIPLQLLLAVRDPAEVMVSVMRRDQAYTGMDAWRAQHLWWHHNAQVLRDGRDLPLQVVSYSHWFQRTSADQQLQQLMPGAFEAQRSKALLAVKPEYRRSQQPTPQGLIHPSIHRLHQHLEQVALQPEQIATLRTWLDQQSPPPSFSHSHNGRLRHRLLNLVGATPQQRIKRHPWRYLAELRVGSDPAAVYATIQHWRRQGFNEAELSHASALPISTPEARREQVPEGNPSQAVLENNDDLEPGPASAKRLLALAGQRQVIDCNRQRVGLLRQFGVPAFWQPT